MLLSIHSHRQGCLMLLSFQLQLLGVIRLHLLQALLQETGGTAHPREQGSTSRTKVRAEAQAALIVPCHL